MNKRPLPISDFIAYSPDHTYIHRPSREIWLQIAVNARVPPLPRPPKTPMSATTWLDRHDAVEQRVWAPGYPEIINDLLVSEGGFFAKPGARVYNLYLPPTLIPASGEIDVWRDHLHHLWPEEAERIELWMAHRVQRPGEKVNHALVLGGEQGIGKDFILEPLKRAIGPWNFKEASPQALLGTFNDFAQAVALRVSEAKDLGEIDRFGFYEATKTLICSPPDTLRINKKFITPYHALNVVGVIFTTNHKTAGIFLPADDRRHYVAWSVLKAAKSGPWPERWKWLDSGGAEAVAHHLAHLDLSCFDPKAPPPHTQAFNEIVHASLTSEGNDLLDLIEDLKRPETLIVGDLIDRIHELQQLRPDLAGLLAFLTERKNSRIISIRLEDCDYRRLSNPDEKQGRWVIEKTSDRRLCPPGNDRSGGVQRHQAPRGL